MDLLQRALHLARLGFHVFPLQPNGKLPAIAEYPDVATTDPVKIKSWWLDPVLEIVQPYNIGISTTHFGLPHAPIGSLVVVDVDVKDGKDGLESIFKLENEGLHLPETFSQVTPSGGSHLFYWCERPMKQGVDVLGSGLDIRSAGGFVVGAGSIIGERSYSIANEGDVMTAPSWLLERLTVQKEKVTPSFVMPAVDRERATKAATHYLLNEAPLSVEGEGGDAATYKVAARVKDFGLSPDDAVFLMELHWNERCSPPWALDDLQKKVAHAFRYGANPIGSSNPELEFPPVDDVDSISVETSTKPHPFDLLNEEYAFVIAGGGSHILWETVGSEGESRLEHLGMQAFHQKLASNTMAIGDGKHRPTTELWMRSRRRRSYDGICFMPGRVSPSRFYNLWRGFFVEPLGRDERPDNELVTGALERFLDHALCNVCRGDHQLFNWLVGFFAHLIQKPWEKPLTALVFRGGKGTGKSSLVEIVGHLLGSHFMITSDKRYLVGNFNGFLENNLLFLLEEAFWSGDKQAEGVLKNLITGKTHVIEHKWKEPYSVNNCTRVVIIGNEDWLVPATQDERRFAVFDVGDGRKQDRQYFHEMKRGMEAGGYRLLLRYLMDFDLSKIDVNAAPLTSALMDQKVASLDPFQQWWLRCLNEGRIVGSEFGGAWMTEIERERFRHAYRRYFKERQIAGRVPEDSKIGKMLRALIPGFEINGRRRDDDGELAYTYKLPELVAARAAWEAFIGHAVEWENV